MIIRHRRHRVFRLGRANANWMKIGPTQGPELGLRPPKGHMKDTPDASSEQDIRYSFWRKPFVKKTELDRPIAALFGPLYHALVNETQSR